LSSHDSTRLGIELACAVQRLYPNKIDWTMAGAKRLIGSTDVVARIARGEGPDEIRKAFQPSVEAFKNSRSKYLLYK
jgi:uncharacterized protein YbbC (DUF1343 family)